MFEKRSTPKMSKLKVRSLHIFSDTNLTTAENCTSQKLVSFCWQDAPSPETGVIVKTAKDGCAEGLVYGGGGKDGIFIKEVVPESPASKSLNLKEGNLN